MLIDYHIHTSYSGDAKGTFSNYLSTAIRKGINEIGFSDHYCINKPDYAMDEKTLKEYSKNVNIFKKDNKFPIKFGIEIDFIPGYESKIKEKIKHLKLDYIIGSVHFIDNWGFDNPKNIIEYKKWDIDTLYTRYFKLIQKSAKSGLFNLIGHMDLIKKFNFKPKNNLYKIYNETIDVIKENNLCIEVNTNGLNFPCKEIFPNIKILELCFEKEVPITISSDAHQPESVGQNFDKALKLIEKVGYKKIVKFTNLKRELVDI